MVEIKKNEALEAESEYRTAVESATDYIENFDILETITNVGNDEVFTPRKTCDMMLDSLPDEVWHNPNYKWLNPATKNGIFEREIAIRLDEGLKDVIPEKEERRKHILQNMIFSIGQTKFTANVARRTVYYCSQANRKCDGIKAADGHYVNGYAIGNGSWFDDEEGNIKTPNIDHKFETDGRCVFCGIKRTSHYVDPLQREQYAYEFLHSDSKTLSNHLQDRFFGGNRKMKFDIIIGNPPYQLSDGGGTGSSSIPIYNLFVQQAVSLNPKYLCMIIPSRWFSGGKGLDDFRNFMLRDKHISLLHDYMDASECFPNNSIEGGVCYFLREAEYNDKCTIWTHKKGIEPQKSVRYLEDNATDIFVRDVNALRILQTISKFQKETFDSLVSSRNPFKLGDPTEICEKSKTNNYKVLGYFDRHREYRWLKDGVCVKSGKEIINKWKLFISKADGAAGQIGNPVPARIMGKAELAEPGTVCSETYLVVGPFNNKKEAENVQAYMATKFFRFMVGIRKNKNMPRETYKSVPIVDFSKKWSDTELYKLFGLSNEEIDYIEKMITEA